MEPRDVEPSRLLPLVLGAARCACVVPFVVAVVDARAWLPVGDTAVFLLRSSQVGSRSSPMLGMPSSLSATVGSPVHHPGPAEFWLFRPVADLGWRVAPFTALFNVTCVVTACLAVRAVGGRRAAVLAAQSAAVMCAALGG
jgi:hypothetical protein